MGPTFYFQFSFFFPFCCRHCNIIFFFRKKKKKKKKKKKVKIVQNVSETQALTLRVVIEPPAECSEHIVILKEIKMHHAVQGASFKKVELKKIIKYQNKTQKKGGGKGMGRGDGKLSICTILLLVIGMRFRCISYVHFFF